MKSPHCTDDPQATLKKHINVHKMEPFKYTLKIILGVILVFFNITKMKFLNVSFPKIMT